MKKWISFLLLISTVSFCETFDDEPVNKADCLILQDENSIICKYEHERLEEDVNVVVQWIDPQGNISRERTLLIPAGHGSVYDFRFAEGREKGVWKFKVKDGDVETETTFTIE